MQRAMPRFVLLSEVVSEWANGGANGWKFTLVEIHGRDRWEESDREPGESEERLHLLSVVRGLQCLEQPSQVTLLTGSRFVSNGIRYGLETWREQGWHWEHFGERVPVRHLDLWKRIDGALSYHRVTARYWNGALWDSIAAAPERPQLWRAGALRGGARVAGSGRPGVPATLGGSYGNMEVLCGAQPAGVV